MTYMVIIFSLTLYFFDYKGDRKKKYKIGLERARAKFRENKDQFVNKSDFINFNNENTNE